ncbi:MAG: PilN domain-containing protein, partial [Candidatus Rokubacteria bacterium]|nr:PilN domain-containing protein [Candidatus Rokubacteria bacterium]
IDLPTVAGELREMIRFELERHLPYPSDDAPFDFLPLPVEDAAATTGAGAEARRVLITAADRRVVEQALRIAEDAKLRPVSITVAAHDLTALVHLPRRGNTVWIHRVGEGADLLFLTGPTLALSRALTVADEPTLVAEIRRSLTLARWRQVDAVWVSGDAEPAAVAGPLAGLGAPVSEPAYTPAARKRLAAIGDGPRGALHLAVAVASGRGVRPLDLLPAPLKPRRLTRPQLITAGTAAATVLLAIGALLAPGWRDTRALAAVDARIAQLDPEVRAVEQVLREVERKRRLLAAAEAASAASVRPLPVLQEVTELLPNDAWLTTIALDPKGVELTGQAAAAAALIPLLENSPRFERVEFASPVTRGRDREQFRIRAAWEGRSAAAGPPAAGGPAR